MKTIKEITGELSKFPSDAFGTVTGIIISNKDHELGFIECPIEDNSPKTFAQRELLASAGLYETKDKLKKAERILEHHRFYPCNIPACNCNSYHYQPPEGHE